MGKLPITERVTGHTELLTLLAYPIRHSISPTETRLLEMCKEAGVKKHMNGLGMMLYQGAAAFKLFTGQDMPIEHMKDILF